MSRRPSGRGITSRAPHTSMPKISPIDTSKLGEATWSSRSASLDLRIVAEPDEVLGDGPVRHRHALGQPGGTRRVDQVGGVVRAAAGGPGRRRWDCRRKSCRDPVTGSRSTSFGSESDRMKSQPILRVGRVDRQVHRSRLDHAQRGDHQLGRLVQQHGDAVLGADALLDQPVREPVRRLVDLAVGVVAALIDHRDRVGCAGDLVRTRSANVVCRGDEFLAVLTLAQPRGVGGAHQVEFAERAVGIGQRAVEQHREVLEQLPGERRIENLHQMLGLDQRPRSASNSTMNPSGSWVTWPRSSARSQRMPGGLKPAPSGSAESEADPGHPLRAVTAVGVELARPRGRDSPADGRTRRARCRGSGRAVRGRSAAASAAAASRRCCRSSR